MENALERKTFSIRLSFPKMRPFTWNKIEYIQVQQASIMQTMEYFRKIKETTAELVIIDILERMRGKDFSTREKKLLALQWKGLQDMRKQSYLYWVDSERNFLKSPGEVSEWSPEGAFFVFLAKELCTPIPVILNEMTREQIWELVIGLSRNANQLTEEGKLRNQNYKYQETFEKENDMDALREALRD